MTRTRTELAEMFRRLDAELATLAASGASDDERWRIVEELAHVPASVVSEEDRLWWWQQLYDSLERYGLTDLASLGAAGR